MLSFFAMVSTVLMITCVKRERGDGSPGNYFLGYEVEELMTALNIVYWA